MLQHFSPLLAAIALTMTTGWLALSDQAGVPLSASEFIQQMGRLRNQVLDQPKPEATVSQNSVSPQAALEQAVHTQVNAYRAQQGLSPLSLDVRMSEIARQHSEDMASGGVPFGHNGFEQRIQAIARTIPYRTAGENVAYNQGYRDSVAQAVEGWINSPGHRANLEGDFEVTGVGIARTTDGKYYFTQLFVRRLL
jgi:uncharacterized protein YkwD